MALRVKRLLLLIAILFCSFTSIYAQTLYWVGGSGNFNDPAHWSLISGGSSSNLIPNSVSNVVFDDKSGEDFVVIDLPPYSSARSFSTINKKTRIVFENKSPGTLNIASSFQLSSLTAFNFTGDVIFRAKDKQLNKINFNLNTLKCNVFFNEGNYNILPLFINDNNKISFKDGGGALDLEPVESAKRELKEETGIVAKNYKEIMRMHLSNSATDELAIVYVATDLTFENSEPEESEVLQLKKNSS